MTRDASELAKANDLVQLLNARWGNAETRLLNTEAALTTAQRRIAELEKEVGDLKAAPVPAEPAAAPLENGSAHEASPH